MTFLLSRTFLGLFYSFIKFREAFHELHEGISMVFLTIAMVLWSNGCLSVETLFKSPIFLILMALTGIVGHVRAPMFLAGNVGNMSATGRNVANFCPDRPILAT